MLFDFSSLTRKELIELICGFITGVLCAAWLVSKGVDIGKYAAWSITILFLYYIEKKMKKD